MALRGPTLTVSISNYGSWFHESCESETTVKIAYLLLVSFFFSSAFHYLFAFFHPQFLAKSYGIACASILFHAALPKFSPDLTLLGRITSQLNSSRFFRTSFKYFYCVGQICKCFVFFVILL